MIYPELLKCWLIQTMTKDKKMNERSVCQLFLFNFHMFVAKLGAMGWIRMNATASNKVPFIHCLLVTVQYDIKKVVDSYSSWCILWLTIF